MSTTNNNAAHNGSIRTNVQDKASEAYTYAQRSLDRVVPPSFRQRAYDSIIEYAQTRPILFVRRLRPFSAHAI